MFKGKKFAFLRHVLGGACLAALAACTPATGEDSSAAVGHREQAVSSRNQLTATEWATYIADQRYIHGLAKPDVRVRLNFADARQYRFVMARLKLAGKTPQSSPYLFEALAAHRQAHVSRGYKAGQFEVADEGSADRREMHYIELASLGETTPAANDAMGSASSTIPDGSWYTWLDVGLSDSSGQPIGDLVFSEEFDAGTNATINAPGDLSQSNLHRFTVASFKLEDSTAGFINSYVYTEVGSDDPVIFAGVPTLAAPQVDAPLDIKFNDNLISVCLNRTWTQDCDYDLTGNSASIKLPLKGSVRITSAHELDVATIDSIRKDLSAGVVRADAGQVKLVLTNVGGGCDVTDGNTLNAKMSMFWNRVTVSADRKTLSWDATAANAAHFDDGCRQVQSLVKLTMLIPLPLRSGNTQSRASITLSNDPNTLRPDFVFKNITVTNSCLAEGTRIQLAGGTLAPIESLQAGAEVFNPYDHDDQALTVTDTAKGFETVPMVRISDEAGRTLLMTEMHPIATVDRGMVQARALRTGDVVMTQTGPSKIEVSRESYDGKVYNLKIGSESELASLGVDQTVVYANGFVVGDGQIQSKYETLAMTQKEGDVLDRLPAQWHRDYLLSRQGK